MKLPALLLLALPLPWLLTPSEPSRGEQDSPTRPSQELAAVLEESGMRADLARGIVAVPVEVLVRDDLLEYLLVGPRGAGHESLFLTGVKPSLLNAVALAAGFQPGKNARPQDVPADEAPEIQPPVGDSLFLYAAWSEDGETYFFRVEDLLSNLATGRSMRRHGWVFLGSRFDTPREGGDEVFLADLEENLINVTFFYQGNTLVTAALEECVDQTIWAANPWLTPPRGSAVWLLLSREKLQDVPAEWRSDLPTVTSGVRSDRDD